MYFFKAFFNAFREFFSCKYKIMQAVASSDYDKNKKKLYQNVAYNSESAIDIDENFP